MSYMNFSTANCKNCYKCLRSCPVKAIKFKNEQAEIAEDRCIACSHCLVICPQNAREIVSDLEKVKIAISSGKRVIATIAPSFAGFFDMNPGKFVSLLKKFGFSSVEETALGADLVSNLYKNYIEQNFSSNYITTACPSANYLVEKYYPSLIKYLIPVVSPMVAHGKILRDVYGEDSFIVFIGPCLGKKVESESFSNKGAIDAVLTFEEIYEWIEENAIEIDKLEDTNFDKNSFIGGRGYALSGGIVDTVKNTLDEKSLEVISVSGTEECIELLESIKNREIENAFIEMSICRGSCIGGPGMVKNENRYFKKSLRVRKYMKNARDSKDNEQVYSKEWNFKNFTRMFIDKSISKLDVSESELDMIMKEMGKHSKEDELNCGVCGYNTCIEKAKAIYEGMAESTMCLHYMRSKAENLRNVIFENTINCMILLDENMNVVDINPAVERAFMIRRENIIDKPISLLMDDKDFKNIVEDRSKIINKKISCPSYNLEFVANAVYLKEQNIVVIAMVNITEEEKSKKELMKLKENTLNAAQEVIDKQMMVAQEIASLLGETTAETKITLTKLKKIVEGENGII